MNLLATDRLIDFPAESNADSRTMNQAGHQKNTPKPAHGLIPAVSRRTLFRDSVDQITIKRDFSVNNSLFQKVVQVRQNARSGETGVDEFDFDSFSYQYCLFVDGQPVGSLTSTTETDGVMDCRAQYPTRLLEAFSDNVFSPCKFNICRNPFSSFRLMRLMVREYWRDQLILGGRLAVMNARTALIPFYQRMGFLVIKDSDFQHPSCGTQSVSLVLPADPSLKSYFSDLFGAVDDPMPIESVRRYCETLEQPKRRQVAMQKEKIVHESSPNVSSSTSSI